MHNTLLLLGLAALTGDLAPQNAAPDRAPRVDAESLEVVNGKLQHAIQAERYEDALVWTKALMAHPDFALLPEEGVAAVYYLAGVLNLELGRPAAALPPLIRATESSGSTAPQWLMRLDTHAAVQDQDGAVRALTIFLDRFPEPWSDLSEDYLLQMAFGADRDQEAVLALRLALFRANWKHEADSAVWIMLVDDLLERDRAVEAPSVVERIATPLHRLQLFSLLRYDALRSPEAVFDIKAAYDADLARDHDRAREPTASADVRNRYVSNLLMLGRLEEALVVADAILGDPGPEVETDPEAASDLTWVMDNRARILLLLHRGDEAVVQQRAAAAREENGRPNVSQTINLGNLLVRVGRHEEAIAAVAPLSEADVSAFGWMQTLQVRGCAAHNLSDAATATPAFAHLDAHWRDAPAATYASLACREDEDGMASLLKDILSDPEHQPIGVALMHRYLDAGDVTDFDRRMSERHKRVMVRDDVVAARDAVGRGFDVPTLSAQF